MTAPLPVTIQRIDGFGVPQRMVIRLPVRRSAMLRHMRVVLACAAFAACSSALTPAIPAPAPAPAAAPPPVNRPVPAARPAAPAPTARTMSRLTLPAATPEQRYAVEATARVERDSAGSRETMELRTSARVSLSLQHEAQRTRGSGMVESFIVSGFDRGAQAAAARGIPAPVAFPFDLTIDSAQIRVSTRPPLANECDRIETAATGLVRDMLVRLPREVAVNDSWQDSSVAFVCRGGVPMAITTRNRYLIERIDARGGDPVLFVARTSETSLEGTSTGAWRTIAVRGSGTGSQALRINGRTGALIELDGQNTLVLTVRDETLTQTGTLRVRSER
jgi:hypothetical protein